MPRTEDGQYELVLENRQVLVIFFVAAVLCGVFFALGYIVGKSTGGAYAPSEPGAAASTEGKKSPLTVGPAEPKASAAPQTGAVQPPSSAKPEEKKPAPPAPQTTKPETKAEAPAGPAATAAAGTITLQVAALSKQEDAEAMVALLKEKKFKVGLFNLAGDNLYHVQVGPFASLKDAEAAKARLEQEGFKPIVRR